MIFRFATKCDRCSAESAQYSAFPTCRECHCHVCPACQVTDEYNPEDNTTICGGECACSYVPPINPSSIAAAFNVACEKAGKLFGHAPVFVKYEMRQYGDAPSDEAWMVSVWGSMGGHIGQSSNVDFHAALGNAIGEARSLLGREKVCNVCGQKNHGKFEHTHSLRPLVDSILPPESGDARERDAFNGAGEKQEHDAVR